MHALDLLDGRDNCEGEICGGEWHVNYVERMKEQLGGRTVFSARMSVHAIHINPNFPPCRRSYNVEPLWRHVKWFLAGKSGHAAWPHSTLVTTRLETHSCDFQTWIRESAGRRIVNSNAVRPWIWSNWLMTSNEEQLMCAYNSKVRDPWNWHKIMRGEARFLSS